MSVILFDVTELANVCIALVGRPIDESQHLQWHYVSTAKRLAAFSAENAKAFERSYREAAEPITEAQILAKVAALHHDGPLVLSRHRLLAFVLPRAHRTVAGFATLARCNLVAQDGTDFATIGTVDMILELATNRLRRAESSVH